MKINKSLNFVAIMGLALAICLGHSMPVRAASGPFVCSSNFYQVISGQLKVLDPTTGLYTNIGVQQADNYNAIGFNVLDNYLYGIKTSVTDGVGSVGDLVRISSDGSTTDLGPVSGMTPANYVNGSFDLAGNMYVRSGNNSIYKLTLLACQLPLSQRPVIASSVHSITSSLTISCTF